MKRENLSIRTKVLFGSILIGVILFFSGAIAFFEFGRMNRYVASLISDNIISANTVNMMADIGEKYNNKLLLGIGAKNDDLMPDMTPNEDFLSSFEKIGRAHV